MVLSTRWARACLVLTAAASLLAQRTPDEALRALQEGNQRFAADKSVPRPLGEGVRRTLARGQNPLAVVLCCADSRVAPEHVFNAGLGELFVVRIAGNTADAETLASIEYAVEQLNVPLCVVLGHESCGAVAAAVAQVQAQEQDPAHADAPSHAVAQLLERIEPAVRKLAGRDLGGKDLTDAAEEENVHLAVHECLRRSPLLRRYAEAGKFRMAAARYHLDSGEVEWLPGRPLPQQPEATADPHGAAVPMTMPPHTAFRLLQAGHRRFLGDGRPTGDLTAHRREQLTGGQRPVAIVLCCADSRVVPEHVFDAGLGELFVVRVAGNPLNDDALASIEYAASQTGAPLLVVMGHSNCGAMAAAAEHPEGQQLTTSMRALLARLEPSVEKARATGSTGRDLVELAMRGNVLRTVAEARSRSAVLRALEQQGRFVMLPAVYDIASGDVTWLEDREEPPPAAPAGETAPAHGAVPPTAPGETHEADGPAQPAHEPAVAAVPIVAAPPAATPAPAAPAVPAPNREPAPAAEAADPARWSGLLQPGGSCSSPVLTPRQHLGHAPRSALQLEETAGAGSALPPTGFRAETPDRGRSPEAAAPAQPASELDLEPLAAALQNPIVLVGLGGVASLLLAALVALLKK